MERGRLKKKHARKWILWVERYGLFQREVECILTGAKAGQAFGKNGSWRRLSGEVLAFQLPLASWRSLAPSCCHTRPRGGAVLSYNKAIETQLFLHHERHNQPLLNCCESSFCRFVLQRVPCIKVAAERVEGSGSIVEFNSAPVLNTNREKCSAGTRLMMKVQCLRRKKSQLKDFFSTNGC